MIRWRPGKLRDEIVKASLPERPLEEEGEGLGDDRKTRSLTEGLEDGSRRALNCGLKGTGEMTRTVASLLVEPISMSY